MKVEKMLEYQSLDSEMYKIERQIKENKNKIVADKMQESIKNAQSRSVVLEDKAGKLLSEIDKVKKQLKMQDDKMQEFLQKDLSKMSKAEVEHLTLLKNKLAQNLQILEKNLATLAENVNAVLSDFNNTIKTYNMAKEELAKSKSAYDNDLKAIESKKTELEGRLKQLAKDCDNRLLEAYLKKRRENVFPVLVPIAGNSCGGCRVEMPYISILKLDEEGVLVCEHCHRINYKQKS